MCTIKRIMIVLALASSGFCFGQDENMGEKKISAGFSFGNGYPLGDYGNIDAFKLPMSLLTKGDTNKIAGYAKRGAFYGGFISCRILGHLCIMLSISGDQNDIDLNTLNSQYFSFFPPNNNLNSVYTSLGYYVTEYFLGPKYSIPVSKNCSIESKVLVGLITVASPPLTYSGADTVWYQYAKGEGFGYNIGAGVNYSINPDDNLVFAIHLNADYVGSEIKFPNYTITTNPFLYNTYNVPKTMTLGILHLSIGLHVCF